MLLKKLKDGSPVNYVAFGDSITFGIGVSDAAAESFPLVLRRALESSFGQVGQVSLLNAGDPGCTTNFALSYLRSHVIQTRPDLVTVQFGGNDSRIGVAAADVAEDLKAIVSEILARTRAVVLLVVPPMEEKLSDFQIAAAVRQVGAECGVPVAEADQALKALLCDFRGLFPWANHPSEYAHAVIGRAVFETLCEYAKARPAVSVRWRRGSTLLTAGQPAVLGASLTNHTDRPVKGTVTAVLEGKPAEQPFTLNAKAEATVEFRWTPPAVAPSGRASRQRLWVRARTEETTGQNSPGDWDVAWATVAPVLEVAAEGKAASQAVTLSAGNLVIEGRDEPTATDLSAVIAAKVRQGLVEVAVDVRDDRLYFGNHGEPYQSDGVEVFFDARGPERQGLPCYTQGVFWLFVTPGQPRPKLTFAGAEPWPRWWSDVQVETHRTKEGYRVTLQFPASSVEALPPGTFGFDLAVDDADTSGGRDAQMAWSGSANNYLIPAWFGGLQLGKAEDAAKPPSLLRLLIR